LKNETWYWESVAWETICHFQQQHKLGGASSQKKKKNWAVLEFRNFLKLLYLSNELNIKKTFNIGIEIFNFDYTFIARKIKKASPKINKASPKKKIIALHFS